MKRTCNWLSLMLVVALVLSIVAIPVSAAEHTTFQAAKAELALFEEIGSLTEDFENDTLDEFNNASAENATGVLTGTWKKSNWWWEMNQGAAGEKRDIVDYNGGKAMSLAGTGTLSGGVGLRYTFDNPLPADAVLDISYEAKYASGTLDNAGVFLSVGNNVSTNTNTATLGRFANTAFHLDTAEADGSLGDNSNVIRSTVGVDNTVKVNSVVNLATWRYNASVQVDNNEALTNDNDRYTLAPFRYTGSEVTAKGTSFTTLDFLVYSNGTMLIDNIVIKAYRYKEIAGEEEDESVIHNMEETFAGRTAGDVLSITKDAGTMSSYINGTDKAVYVNRGNGNMGVTMNNKAGYINYVMTTTYSKDTTPKVQELEFYTEFTMQFPATVVSGYNTIINWRQNGYKFLELLTIKANGANYGAYFRKGPYAWGNEHVLMTNLTPGEAYKFVSKSYPNTSMVYMQIFKESDNSLVYEGAYRHGLTENSETKDMQIGRLTIYETVASNVIYDDFKAVIRTVEPIVTDAVLTENFDDCTFVPYGRTYQFGNYAAVLSGSVQNIASNGGMMLTGSGTDKAVSIAPKGNGGSNAMRYHFTTPLSGKKAINLKFDYTHGGEVSGEVLDVIAANGTDITNDRCDDAMRILHIKDGVAGAYYGHELYELEPGETYTIQISILPFVGAQRIQIADETGEILRDGWFREDGLDWAAGQLNASKHPAQITDLSFVGNLSNNTSTSAMDNFAIWVEDGMFPGVFYDADDYPTTEFSAGDLLKYKVALDEGEKTVKVLIAYYDSNKTMLKAEVKDIANLETNGYYVGETTVPAGATSVKGFVWDMDMLHPYTDIVELRAGK